MAGFDIRKLIGEMQRNRTRTMYMGFAAVAALAALVGGGIMLNSWHVFGGGDHQKDSVVALGQPITLAGGALEVRVTGAQERPLSTFGDVSEADAETQMVALQVDMAVQYAPDKWADKTPPKNIGDILKPDGDAPTIEVDGTSNWSGKSGYWQDLVQLSGSDASDGSVYDLQDQPVPPAATSLNGSYLFKVPIDAKDLVLVFADYGSGSNANASGKPIAIYRVRLSDTSLGE